MTMSELFSGELEREAAATRRVLERVPEGRYDWKPHEKSMTLGRLSSLVATMPAWVEMMMDHDSLDLARGGTDYEKWNLRTAAALVSAHDQYVAEAKESLARTSDEHLMTTWRLLVAGKAVSENARYIMLRDSVFNHLVHHRGQLTVYLRLNDASVPAIYGPSADEGWSE